MLIPILAFYDYEKQIGQITLDGDKLRFHFHERTKIEVVQSVFGGAGIVIDDVDRDGLCQSGYIVNFSTYILRMA